MEYSLGGRIAKALGIDDREPSAFERALVDKIGSKNLDRVIIATDVIMSVAPGASAIKDGFEAVTGHNATNGQPLSAFDRGVAVFGVLTLGAGSSLIHGTQALSKAAKAVDGGRAVEQLVGSANTVAKIADKGRDLEKVTQEVIAAEKVVAEQKGGLNLFKWKSPTTTIPAGWREGDFMLHLPDQGSPKANWHQNAGRLREQMGKGNPIFDSYRDPTTGMQIPTTGFLAAERYLLESRGWTYNPLTGAYHPPVP
jgi:hypothetical protein